RNAGRSSGDRHPARGRRLPRTARRPQATCPVATGPPGAAPARIPPSVAARQARTRPPPAPARAPTRTSSARRARSAPRASASTCRSQRAYVRSAAAQLLPPPARRRRPRPTPAPTWPPRSGATRPSSRCACRPVTRRPAGVTRTRVINEGAGGRRPFVFVPGPVFAHSLLADEINRATPRTQAALLEAMAEQQVTVAGTSYPLTPPFFVLATLNPIEMEGTYQLPEAQLDRFLFKVLLDYPSGAELERILGETTAAELPAVRPVLPRETAARRVEELKHLVRQVP